MEGRSGQREQSKMVCKENKTKQERETNDEKKWERRKGEWKEGKTGTERQKETQRGLKIFLVPRGFSLPASVPKRPEFTLFLEVASTFF